MKGYSKYFIIVFASLLSCETDFDLLTKGDIQPVVYCVVDPTEMDCYIKLSAIYQDSSLVCSGDSNLGDLKIGQMEIFMEAWGQGYKLWHTTFSPVNSSTDSLSSDKHYGVTYKSDKKMKLIPTNRVVSDEVKSYDFEYMRLCIKSPQLEQPAYSRIEFIPGPIAFYPQSPMDINLYGDPDSHFDFKVDPDKVRTAELICTFFFEKYDGRWEKDEVTFILKRDIPITVDHIKLRLYDDSFFNKLVPHFSTDTTIEARRFLSMDFTFNVSDKYFEDYCNSQKFRGYGDFSNYTNITNGLGLFSMKRSKTFTDNKFDARTLDSLCYGQFTKHLKFVKW